MIWESTPLMTLFDLAFITMAVAAFLLLRGRRKRLGHHGLGTTLVMVGLAVLGAFYLADLFAMLALPLMIPRPGAAALMRNLHLNYSWIANFLGAGAIFAGLTIVVGRIDSTVDSVRKSEERFRGLFENIPISTCEEDFSEVLRYLDDLGFREIEDFEAYLEGHSDVVRESASRVHVLAVNRHSLELHEAKDKGELLESLSATFTEESYAVFKEQLLAIWRGETRHESQARVRTLSGARRDVVLQWQVAPGHEDTLSRVFVTLTDISERVRAEEELRVLNLNLERRAGERAAELKAAMEEVERVFELSVDMICIADIDGHFRKLNPAWTATLGYTEEELLGVPYLDFVHPDDREATLRVIREKLELGEPVINFENRYRHKDGSCRWLMWTSRPDVVRGLTYAIARDVTSEKEAAEALHRDRIALEQLVAERTVELVATNERLREEVAERVRTEEDLCRHANELARSNAELRGLNRLAVGRELRMIELKRQVNELLEEAGKPPAYDTSFAPDLIEADVTVPSWLEPEKP